MSCEFFLVHKTFIENMSFDTLVYDNARNLKVENLIIHAFRQGSYQNSLLQSQKQKALIAPEEMEFLRLYHSKQYTFEFYLAL